MRKASTQALKRRSLQTKRMPQPRVGVSRYDANIDHILRSAAAVFAEKSFGLASIRDIAARARISFPRIYYYLRNKEELLYLISRRAFDELIRRASERLQDVNDPARKLKLFVESHLDYHMNNLAEMKVLVRETDTLSGEYAADIARLKREYSRIGRRVLDELAQSRGKTLDREAGRILTSLLFGAMNWFYTWYDPARDNEQRRRIMDEVSQLFLGGISAR